MKLQGVTRAAPLVLGWAVIGCGEHSPAALGVAAQAVLYGADDRIEYRELEPGPLRQIIGSSTVALIERVRLAQHPDGSYALDAAALQQAYGLCDGARFAEQVTAAFCGGVLLAPDVVLTAGHCVPSERACEELVLARNYALPDQRASQLRLSPSDLFACKRVLYRVVEASPHLRDFALLELDRPAADARLPALRLRGSLDAASPFVMAGFGLGLPMKIDPNVAVLDHRRLELDYAHVSADAFARNSGSPIFTETGDLVALLAAGEPDWVLGANGCASVRRVGDDCSGCVARGERALYLGSIAAQLCELGVNGACEGACGDGVCQDAETEDGCPGDCTRSTCGDALCQANETAAQCALDCPVDEEQRPPDKTAGARVQCALSVPIAGHPPFALCVAVAVGLGWRRLRRARGE
ncbi:MAG TPA: serine protease [Polyangiaceae bacterium]|nr:serine protease [Polyangiaceae bacterium]